ncbi:MAG: DUF3857 and transglutaminase domain-containing protein [Pseudomonadota bacterium]
MHRSMLAARRWAAALSVCLASGFTQAAHGSTANGTPALTVENESVVYTVDSDGSYVKQRAWTKLINTAEAAATQLQQDLRYDRAVSRLTIESARLTKANGQHIEVPAADIRDEADPAVSKLPDYDHLRVLRVRYAGLAAGDQITLRYSLTLRAPLVSGQFQHDMAPSAYPTKQLQLVLDLPQALDMVFRARDFKFSIEAAQPGRRRYRWDYLPGETARTEQHAIGTLATGARLSISTYTDARILAGAYEDGTAAARVPDAAVRAFAHQIADGVNERARQADAIVRWVREHIILVKGSLSGAARWAPHSAVQILKARHGDANEHVILARALLDALGIANSTALLNASTLYEQPELPLLNVLYHPVLYLPDGARYLECAQTGSLVHLPPAMLDKPALLTSSGEYGHTPATRPGSVTSTSEITLAIDGSAQFTSVEHIEGKPGLALANPDPMTPEGSKTMVPFVLTQQGLNGSGGFASGPRDDLASRFEQRYEGKIDKLAAYPGLSNLDAMSSVSFMLGRAVRDWLLEARRSQDFVCFDAAYDERARLLLPAGGQIVALPAPLHIHQENLDFDAELSQEGQAVLVRRRLQFTHARRVCTPSEFDTLREAFARIDAEMKRQIFIRTP